MDSDRLRQLLANPIFPVWGPRELAMISSNVGHGQPSAPLSRGYYDEIGGGLPGLRMLRLIGSHGFSECDWG